MKIPNPWPYHANRRCICKPAEGEPVISLQSARGNEIDVPDGTVEVMIEPIKFTGRGGKCEAIGQCKVWSREWGLLDLNDYENKKDIERQSIELKEKQQADQIRKAKEARERAEAKTAKEEKPAKEETCGPKIRLDDERK